MAIFCVISFIIQFFCNINIEEPSFIHLSCWLLWNFVHTEKTRQTVAILEHSMKSIFSLIYILNAPKELNFERISTSNL